MFMRLHSIWPRWLRERPLDTPSVEVDAVCDCSRMDTSQFGPRSERVGFVPELNHPARSPVPRLFFGGSPTAIAGLIALLVIPAFNGVPLARAFSHVGQESFKRPDPFRAYLNTAPTISLIRSAARIKASLFHGSPDVVGSRGLPTAIVAMPILVRRGSLPDQTPATSRGRVRGCSGTRASRSRIRSDRARKLGRFRAAYKVLSSDRTPCRRDAMMVCS